MKLTFFYLDSLPFPPDSFGMFIRDCKQFINLKRLSNCKDDDGIVLIEEKHWRTEETLVYELIKKYAYNKNLLFMLCDTSEGYPTKFLYYPFFDFLKECGIDKHRRLFMYNNALHTTSVKECETFYSIYYPSFLYEFAQISSQPKIKKDSVGKYDFSCFNRKSKNHKVETVKEIVNRSLNCATTFDFFNDIDYTHSSFLKLDSLREGSYLHDESYFLGKVNICTESEFYNTKHPKSSSDAEHQWGDMIHLTEKVFRNIAFGIPYVLISSKNSINEIKRLGFKTFDSMIDESYDSSDDSVRIKLALNAANDLLNQYNTTELNDILDYNKRKILKYSTDFDFFNSQLLEPLKKHINNLDN